MKSKPPPARRSAGSIPCFSFVAALTLLAFIPTAHAQWLTQNFQLRGGWNAIYTHVDASHTTLDNLILSDESNPIREVWHWNPASSALQFVVSPQEPTGAGTAWSSWLRGNEAGSTLKRWAGNAAYLVRVDGAVATYNWSLKGRPVPPKYQWTTTGLNFVGFPTPPALPPTFETFLSGSAELQSAAEIFQYPGGELGPENPIRLFARRTTYVKRGESFWIRSPGVFNRYFGPIEFHLQSPDGVHFGDSLSQYRITLRNLQTAPVTVTLRLINSEVPPVGQEEIVQLPPVLVRGTLNPANLQYSHTILGEGTHNWPLAARGSAGSELEIVLGLNRSQMTAPAHSFYAGILRLTDSLDLSEIDIPISAKVASTSGLWVGEATVSQVGQYLKTYARDGDGKPIPVPSPSDNPSNVPYQVTAINTALAPAARSVPLRLILHRDSVTGETRLLQRVYHGLRSGSTLVLATRENLLDPDQLQSARRISAAHLPFSPENNPWPRITGDLRMGESLVFNVTTIANDPRSNPFLHSYHPDHDNLDVDFKTVLPQGSESFRVDRQITLTVTAPGSDFASLTSSSHQFSGSYGELVTFFGRNAESRQFEVSGSFVVNRISPLGALTLE